MFRNNVKTFLDFILDHDLTSKLVNKNGLAVNSTKL